MFWLLERDALERVTEAQGSPRRLRRRRTKGWRMPAGAIYVGRPTKWGNPFVLPTRAESVEAFAAYLAERPDLVARARQELRGHDLVCWCPPDEPCHADVWLELANRR